MVGFFDELVDPSWLAPQWPGSSDAPWLGPPCDVLPGQLSGRVALVDEPGLTIWLSGMSAYPCGARFELEARWAARRQVQLPLVPGARGRRGLCLGAAFEDGTRVLARPRLEEGSGFEPAGPVLVAAWLRARVRLATTELWLWPLPQSDFEWVLEWRNQGVSETRVQAATAELRSAAGESVELWTDAVGGRT